MKTIFLVCVIKIAFVLSTYNYEKQSSGFGRRVFPRINPSNSRFLPVFDTAGRPDPLPTPRRSLFAGPNYHNLTQGIPKRGNKRVYNKVFDVPARNEGQQLFFRGDYYCTLSRLAVYTVGCMPTLLRGGVGYRYFLVLVRAKAGVHMQGRVRAWCQNISEAYFGAW